jgi:protein O-mannosyl-transferase
MSAAGPPLPARRPGGGPAAASSALVASGVALFAFLLYLPSLANGFVYDDIPQVVENPWIRDPRSLPQVFTTGAWSQAATASNYYRPVMHALYMATYAVFGPRPTGFHLVNALLDAGVCALVFLTAHLVLRSAAIEKATSASAFAALVFAAHPVHVEAVSWIGGIPDLCAALFCLGALYLHARPGRTRAAVAASVALFLLATLSKEIALAFPAVLFAHDLAFRRPRPLRSLGPYLAAAAVYFALRWNALGGMQPVRRHEELGPGGVLLNVFPLVGAYLAKLVAPVGLSAFHAFDPVESPADPRALAGIGVALLLAAAAAFWLRRQPAAWFSLCALLFPLAPALYIPALGENPFAERYLYLPSAGFVWLLALGAAAVRPPWKRPLALAAALSIAVLAAGTIARQRVWKSDRALWQDTVAKSPGAPIAHYNLAVSLKNGGDLDGAIAEYTEALRIGESPIAWSSLGDAYVAKGLDAQALAAFGRAIQLDPAYAPAWNDLGALQFERGRTREAVESFTRAVAADPGMAEARENLARARERLRSEAGR